MGHAGAAKLLRAKFPELSDVLPKPDDPEFDGSDAYHASAEFAKQVSQRRNDEGFLASACLFIDDLALTGQRVLQEMFGEVLETLTQDAGLCRQLRPRLHSETQEALRASL
jgi:hypothetical protein